MAEYIDKDKLIRDLIDNRSFYPAIVKNAIELAPIEDVVPRSEVEKLIVERETYKAHSYNTQTLLNTINQKIMEGYELSAAKACAEMEMWQKVALREKQLTERIDNLIKTYAECQKEFAREIFEEIEKRLAMYSHIHKYAEEANKVTEEYADGSPVEMTSVWDACRLEHNGYDDYETMCKLQDNIGSIEKSRLLKELEGDIAQLKKKYIGE